MEANLINIGLGFIEGLALIISPCILPILPIILAGSLTGSRKRPIGIVVGFILFFSVFTFFSRKLVQYSGIDINIIRHVSYFILAILGIIMLSTYLTEKFNALTQRLLNVGSSFSTANNPEGGLWSGILFGGLIAIIWTPCAGPILAAVIVQTVIQQSNLQGFLTVFAFGMGAAVPMLLIAMFGRGIMNKFSFFKTHAYVFRKILGLIILISIAYMIFLERGATIGYASTANNSAAVALQDELSSPYTAPEIGGIEAWINSKPLQISELKGKVVLIDFWTYSCINCIRTLPYIKDWYAKYHDKGLVIIGIHSPEFDFEKNLSNVENAVKQDGIQYPVALDNQFVTWRNFDNHYWPAHFLINKEGKVVFTHFGEGKYEVTENNIRYLLGIKNAAEKVEDNTGSSMFQTPETYFGYGRAANFASPENVMRDQVAQYSFPESFKKHQWALSGKWKIMSDRIVAESADAALQIRFYARQIFVVMGNTTDKDIQVSVTLNGKKHGDIQVKQHTLYDVVKFDDYTDGVLNLQTSAPGLEMYTFTFG